MGNNDYVVPRQATAILFQNTFPELRNCSSAGQIIIVIILM